QNRRVPLQPRHGVLQVKDHAVGLVQAAYESSDLGSHHPLEWKLFSTDYVDRDAPRTQRCRDLEANEAAAHNDDLLCRRGSCRERAAIGVSAKIEDLRVCTRNRKPDRVSSHRQQQPVEIVRPTVLGLDPLLPYVERGHACVESELYT